MFATKKQVKHNYPGQYSRGYGINDNGENTLYGAFSSDVAVEFNSRTKIFKVYQARYSWSGIREAQVPITNRPTLVFKIPELKALTDMDMRYAADVLINFLIGLSEHEDHENWYTSVQSHLVDTEAEALGFTPKRPFAKRLNANGYLLYNTFKPSAFVEKVDETVHSYIINDFWGEYERLAVVSIMAAFEEGKKILDELDYDQLTTLTELAAKMRVRLQGRRTFYGDQNDEIVRKQEALETYYLDQQNRRIQTTTQKLQLGEVNIESMKAGAKVVIKLSVEPEWV